MDSNEDKPQISAGSIGVVVGLAVAFAVLEWIVGEVEQALNPDPDDDPMMMGEQILAPVTDFDLYMINRYRADL